MAVAEVPVEEVLVMVVVYEAPVGVVVEEVPVGASGCQRGSVLV